MDPDPGPNPADWSVDVPAGARGGALAIGNFDGVHRGHAAILAELRRLAAAVGGPAVAVTFDPHPVAVLRPEHAPPLLTDHPRRAALLREAGADAVVRLPVTPALLAHSAEAFFDRVLLDAFAAKGLVEGGDFRFGKDRRGDVALLRTLGGPHGLRVTTVGPVEIDGEAVSSSRVRRLIAAGEVDGANALLGRPHRIAGAVAQGDGRGRTLGFPTANLAGVAVLVPGPGVYAGRCEVDRAPFAVVLHLGPRPTFDAAAPVVEAHLLDFAGDLYGRELAVDVLRKVRGVRKFAGPDELAAQLRRDIAAVRAG